MKNYTGDEELPHILSACFFFWKSQNSLEIPEFGTRISLEQTSLTKNRVWKKGFINMKEFFEAEIKDLEDSKTKVLARMENGTATEDDAYMLKQIDNEFRVLQMKNIEEAPLPDSFSDYLNHISETFQLDGYYPEEYMAVKLLHNTNYMYLDNIGVYKVLNVADKMVLARGLGNSDLADIIVCFYAICMVLQPSLLVKIVANLFKNKEEITCKMIEDLLAWTRAATDTKGIDTTIWMDF